MLYFCLHSMPCIFFSLQFPHELFRSMLFSFHVFGDFPFIFVVNFLFDSILVGEHTLTDFNSFKFIKLYFMAQDMVFLGYVPGTVKKMYSAVVRWSLMSVTSCWLTMVSSVSMVIFYSVVYQLRQEGCSLLKLWICLFLLSVFQSASQIHGSAV